MVDNELRTKSYLPRQCISFWQSSLGSIKRVKRVKQLSRPSHSPSFHSPAANISTKMDSPNTYCKASDYVPRFIMLPGVSLLLNSFICFVRRCAKSWCLGKLSHPSPLIREVKTVMFIPKIALFILRWFWDIILVDNELSTKSTSRVNALASENQI